MDEHAYIRAVHRKLPKEIYKWKVAARFVRGIPDAWYSGYGADLWVEYKWLRRTPRRAFTVGLSQNQRIWLNARYEEGRNVAVIIGTSEGGMILTAKGWEIKATIPTEWLTIEEVARWISNSVS